MIPKKAWFYWSSLRPMSWLRSLGVATFKKHNPDWDVTLYCRQPGEMHPVHASDLWRYETLAEEGGVYFDTDIIFFRPVPEELLQHDTVLSFHPRHRFCNIGCLMSKPDNQFFRDVASAATTRYGEAHGHRFWDGQLIGTPLLNRMYVDVIRPELRELDTAEIQKHFAERYQQDWSLLPLRFVTPIDSYGLHKLFNEIPFRPPDESIGVHWYAGDKFNSKPFEKRITEENYHQWNCYLTQAIKAALHEPVTL